MQRKLTVSSLFLSQRSPIEDSYCPFLRLSGRWLAKSGFKIGQTVLVEVGTGKLVITPVVETKDLDSNQVEAGLPAERSRNNVTA